MPESSMEQTLTDFRTHRPSVRFSTRQGGTGEVYIASIDTETESGVVVSAGDFVVGFEEGHTLTLSYDEAVDSDPDDKELQILLNAAKTYLQRTFLDPFYSLPFVVLGIRQTPLPRWILAEEDIDNSNGAYRIYAVPPLSSYRVVSVSRDGLAPGAHIKVSPEDLVGYQVSDPEDLRELFRP
jgi:hypothetical protein